VTKIGELGTTQAASSNRRTILQENAKFWIIGLFSVAWKTDINGCGDPLR
jgi:hypothetical protein